MEIRIYYEVYEQAHHFLRRSVQRFAPEAEIRLVKLNRIKASSVIARRIREALHFKNPDALITWVERDVERPLAMIEISAAVETEDHDLQRYDAFLASALAGCPLVKVYAARQSRATGGHGGNLNYDRTLAFKLLLQRRKSPGFLVEWPLVDAYTATRHDENVACPPDLEALDRLLSAFWSLRDAAPTVSEAVLANQDALPTEAADQLAEFRKPIHYQLRARSTRLFADGDEYVLKFNRWDHAMDPERGMSWFARDVLEQRLIGHLTDKTATTTEEAYDHFCRATKFDPERLHEPADETMTDISTHVASAELNRSGMAIFSNCHRFRIHNIDGDLLLDLEWAPADPTPPLLGYEGDMTKLLPVEGLSEDEVTYVVAYDVLRSNGFHLVSLSYPGDQGSFALLTGPPGRHRLRTYIDIIAFRGQAAVSLTEAKGPYTVGAIESAIEKVLVWKTSREHRHVLLERVGEVVEYDGEPVIVSVAFADKTVARLTSKLNDLDYFVVVTPERWRLWTSDDSMPFDVQEGDNSLAERWCY